MDWIGVDHEMNVTDVQCGKPGVARHSLQLGVQYMSMIIQINFIVLFIYIYNAVRFVL